MKVVLEPRTRSTITNRPVKARVKVLGTPGPSGGGVVDTNYRTLENNDIRITESGDFRILE